jgi:selenocysteine lyase/cysteine desulfurase
MYGGTGTVSESIEMPMSGSSRFEAGSHNISAVAGLNASLKWLHETGRDSINNKIVELTSLLIHELKSLYELTVYTPTNLDTHSGVVSISLENVLPQAIENALGAQNIAVRAGLHCSPWVHQFMETQSNGGTVRVSLGYFNEEADIQKLIRIIQSII